MADYYTNFSCMLEQSTPDNVARALEIYRTFADEIDRDGAIIGFLASAESEDGGTQLWIRDDVTGDPEHVIVFVLRCAEALDLKGCWGFEWANTCSKPRLDAFGGGAHLIDLEMAESLRWVSTNEWLTEQLVGDQPAKE